ncbi:MAG: DUF4381 domain-containing protein [Acidobacteriota bacterium]|nr:MAG: DUF4381 domain-containing protein [Acidobacteriota bacterium]
MNPVEQLASPALENLHDIVLPEPVAWTPQTAGWWLLLTIAVLISGWAVWVGLRRRHRNAYRRAALSQLDGIEAALREPSTRAEALAQLPVLLKRTALSFCRREKVASLSGERWLAFLDASYGSDAFTTGPGRMLPRLAYASPASVAAIEQADLDDLVRLVRTWIRRHRVRV